MKRFVEAVNRTICFMEKIRKKNEALEEILCDQDKETRIFDFTGVNELVDTLVDLTCVMFPNISEDEILENINWYIYEATSMKEPYIVDKGKTYIINNPEDLYNYLVVVNEKSIC